MSAPMSCYGALSDFCSALDDTNLLSKTSASVNTRTNNKRSTERGASKKRANQRNVIIFRLLHNVLPKLLHSKKHDYNLQCSLAGACSLPLFLSLSHILFGGIRIIRRENKQELEIRGDREKNKPHKQTNNGSVHTCSLVWAVVQSFPWNWKGGCDDTELIFLGNVHH